jgi:hypothetical protein
MLPKLLLITKFNPNRLCLKSQLLRNFSNSTYKRNKNVAMVLSGCGVYDGTEIIEATSAIIHLSKHNANVSFFAPNIEQLHVINHLNGDVLPETR